jgi:hypothetical protein
VVPALLNARAMLPPLPVAEGALHHPACPGRSPTRHRDPEAMAAAADADDSAMPARPGPGPGNRPGSLPTRGTSRAMRTQGRARAAAPQQCERMGEGEEPQGTLNCGRVAHASC